MQPESRGVNGAAGDRRRTRWAAHRKERREELIKAAIEAFFQHGPDVDMAQVAAVAGVSKPVLYRYFADKSQLWQAVGQEAAVLAITAIEKSARM